MARQLSLTKDDLIAELETVWGSIRSLAVEISDEEWASPTRLPGWCVRDTIAHIIGTESMLLGIDMPDVTVGDEPHLLNDIGRFNEAWVLSFEDASPAEMLDAFDDVTGRRIAALTGMSQAEFDEIGWTPAGQKAYGRFMQIRVFDSWMHEQDIRAAVDRSGHLSGPVVDRSIAEISTALGYVIGKKGGAPSGSSVSLRVTSPDARRLDVVVGERAEVVDEIEGEPTVVISTDLPTFAALVGGREPVDELVERVQIEGDRELGDRVARNLAFVI